MNPSDHPATVDARFLPFNSRPAQDVRLVLAPRSAVRMDTSLYMPRQSFSAIVTADLGIVVERDMRFGVNQRGEHMSAGTTTPTTVWQFAQADTVASRQTFFTVLNPNPAAPAVVTATLLDLNGKPISAQTIIVDPLHRGNIKVNAMVGDQAAVSALVTSNLAVVVERPQYVGPANLDQAIAGSDILGRNGGAPTWSFPAGSTLDGDQSTAFLFNPGTHPATVTVRFFPSLAGETSRTIVVAGNSRVTYDVNARSGLPGTRFGVTLESANGAPIVAELGIWNPALARLDSSQGIAG